MQVQDHSPEPAKGKRMKTVPKYPTLLAVLGMDDEANDPAELTADPEVDALMQAMLTNTSGWSGFSGA